MRSTALILAVLTLAGCEQTQPRGVLVPAPAEGPASRPSGGGGGSRTGGGGDSAPAATPKGPQGSFDFEANDRKEDEEIDPDADPMELQADLVGVDPADLEEPPPAAPAAGSGAALPGLPVPQWQPDQPIDGSWGMRVVATLHDVQPPRAVVAMPDGAELVVQPGQMLPNYRMVVLAVGRNAVQVARVTPQGFYAKVETETVASLAPASVAPPTP